MTLEQFVKKIGTQEEAAHIVGVPVATFNRWIKGHTKVSPLARMRLKELGVKA